VKCQTRPIATTAITPKPLRSSSNSENHQLSQAAGVLFPDHDPSTLTRQGNDRGASYRSAIFYTSDAQKRIAEDTHRRCRCFRPLAGKVVTEVAPAVRSGRPSPSIRIYLEKYLTATPVTSFDRTGRCRIGRRKLRAEFRPRDKSLRSAGAALENEGVGYIFAIPGEENLDVPASPTRCCSTTRSRRWGQVFLRRSQRR